MKRLFGVIGILVFVGLMILASWALRTGATKPAKQGSLDEAIHSAVSDPAGFAKAHFTGGIGAVMADAGTGGPMVMSVLPGSPAEKAGLLKGDKIVAVDGAPTAGVPLAQNVEKIRGFIAGSVTLTIQRAGTTNLQCVIRRNSWNSLGVPINAPPTPKVTPIPGQPLR